MGDVRRGERVYGAKLDESRVREIRARAAGGESYRALARAFDVDPANIRQIVIRATWKHVACS